jgi:oxygen-independent coproporphyrinogen-3 oxidase
MTIYIEGHSFRYETENLCRIFFPHEKFNITEALANKKDDTYYVYTARVLQQGTCLLAAEIRFGEHFARDAVEIPCGANPQETDHECERELAVLLFGLLTDATGIHPSWGILTGVRPIKLMRKLTAQYGEEAATRYFTERLLVTPQKAALALRTAQAEQRLLAESRPESYSLYVSIPFCPTRCAYCSFVSHTVEKAARLIPEYVIRLCEELEYTGKIAREIGLRLETVYIGGGTPTTLSADQLACLIDTIRNHFDLNQCREFTVEAGRPDTITKEKLNVLKQHGVGRISINPQTMNQEVLTAIGRKHSVTQTKEAFLLARALGFSNINMDLIAGLPGDDLASFQNTLEQIMEFSPESITIHTLSMKRSSNLTLQGYQLYSKKCAETENMHIYAGEHLPAEGYAPYYLYRQSRMVGNLENIGWAKVGFEGLYNVYVMDETHTVLACGAGAVSKLKEPGTEHLERIFNYKYPYEYLSRFEEMIKRKGRVKEFYEQLQKGLHPL